MTNTVKYVLWGIAVAVFALVVSVMAYVRYKDKQYYKQIAEETVEAYFKRLEEEQERISAEARGNEPQGWDRYI